jgi:hypothetical protein
MHAPLSEPGASLASRESAAAAAASSLRTRAMAAVNAAAAPSRLQRREITTRVSERTLAGASVAATVNAAYLPGVDGLHVGISVQLCQQRRAQRGGGGSGDATPCCARRRRQHRSDGLWRRGGRRASAQRGAAEGPDARHRAPASRRAPLGQQNKREATRRAQPGDAAGSGREPARRTAAAVRRPAGKRAGERARRVWQLQGTPVQFCRSRSGATHPVSRRCRASTTAAAACKHITSCTGGREAVRVAAA